MYTKFQKGEKFLSQNQLKSKLGIAIKSYVSHVIIFSDLFSKILTLLSN